MCKPKSVLGTISLKQENEKNDYLQLISKDLVIKDITKKESEYENNDVSSNFSDFSNLSDLSDFSELSELSELNELNELNEN